MSTWGDGAGASAASVRNRAAVDGNRVEHVQSAKSLGVIINHRGKVDSRDVVVVECALGDNH